MGEDIMYEIPESHYRFYEKYVRYGDLGYIDKWCDLSRKIEEEIHNGPRFGDLIVL